MLPQRLGCDRRPARDAVAVPDGWSDAAWGRYDPGPWAEQPGPRRITAMPSTTTETRTRAAHNAGSQTTEEHDEQLIDQAIEHRAERTRKYMNVSVDRGQDAVRAYVRAVNDAALSLVPRAVFRPGLLIRTSLDLLSMTIDFQRAMWDELLQVGREDLRRAERHDDRVDWDNDWERERERIGR